MDPSPKDFFGQLHSEMFALLDFLKPQKCTETTHISYRIFLTRPPKTLILSHLPSR